MRRQSPPPTKLPTYQYLQTVVFYGDLPQGSNYQPPQRDDPLRKKCDCNTVFYALITACSLCQVYSPGASFPYALSRSPKASQLTTNDVPALGGHPIQCGATRSTLPSQFMNGDEQPTARSKVWSSRVACPVSLSQLGGLSSHAGTPPKFLSTPQYHTGRI